MPTVASSWTKKPPCEGFVWFRWFRPSRQHDWRFAYMYGPGSYIARCCECGAREVKTL